MPEAPPPPAPAGDAARPAGDESSSLLVLLTGVIESLAVYLAAKLRLARAEMSRDLRRLEVAAALCAACAILLLAGLGFAGAALALPLARWTGSMTAALAIIAGCCLILAAAIVVAVRARLRKWGGFLPASRADLERDLEWLKQLK